VTRPAGRPGEATGADGPGPEAQRAPLTPGPVLFARYAYPPNSLGYCGPGDPMALLGAAAEGADVTGLGQLAARFEGAWPYLQLLASCSGIADPLDRRVVEAYWVGNELLSRVPGSALAHSLSDRFERRAGGRFESMVSAVPAGGIPQHSFHVFAVYPWLGLLRAGMEGPPLEVLDRCRIRWGRIEVVAGDMVAVASRALIFDGSRLALGPVRSEPARRSVDGVGFVGDLRPGDVVSLHWDWVCDRLSPRALGWLRHCTRQNLDAVNALAVPGPAVVCDA
jgi:Family of unknown function (DUF6390)